MTGEARVPEFAPHRFRAAIFDLDGTLVESEHVWERAKVAVLGRHGRTATRAQLDASVGRGLRDFLADTFGPALTDDLRRRLVGQIETEAELWLNTHRRPVPGARDWLVALSDTGLRIAVCSSSPRRHIASALEMLGIADRVELSVSGAELPLGKPHPLPFSTAIEALGLRPAEAFAVEDSLAGARAAHDAGLFTLAVGAGCTAPEFGFCDLRAESFAALRRDLA